MQDLSAIDRDSVNYIILQMLSHIMKPTSWLNGISTTYKKSTTILLKFMYSDMITTQERLYNE